ncbi:hypothetical protein SAMN03080599_01166 [Acidaminobacter hydrogenoformans DSM 2784]|uniref:Uncharacterized protein n=1 Tax=Acidaminobacter hydrogenoformans DSM 2784 TaxID=1120920 RepID=A0A1G5RWC9_9FIRM|nr:hypothetical protein SAMN03080599_01166 [Acidaminobacter hydrogenoformans DSM 2784]
MPALRQPAAECRLPASPTGGLFFLEKKKASRPLCCLPSHLKRLSTDTLILQLGLNPCHSSPLACLSLGPAQSPTNFLGPAQSHTNFLVCPVPHHKSLSRTTSPCPAPQVPVHNRAFRPGPVPHQKSFRPCPQLRFFLWNPISEKQRHHSQHNQTLDNGAPGHGPPNPLKPQPRRF